MHISVEIEKLINEEDIAIAPQVIYSKEVSMRLWKHS